MSKEWIKEKALAEDGCEVSAGFELRHSRMTDIKITDDTINSYRDKLEKYITSEKPERYLTRTVLLDMLYFMGAAIDEDEFGWAGGFDKFKEVLREVMMCDSDSNSRRDNNSIIVNRQLIIMQTLTDERRKKN